jgi:5-methylthioribose kinase
VTVRIRFDRSSYILKQARPWVVKYPHLPAPVERVPVEAAFYEVAAPAEEVAVACLAFWDSTLLSTHRLHF